MKWQKLFKCAFLMLLVAFVVINVGCAREYIASKIQNEIIRQIDLVDVAGIVTMIMAGFFTFLTSLINTYIKQDTLRSLVLANMHKADKQIEAYLVANLKTTLAWIKEEVGELDLTKPIVPQLTTELKEYFNKMKHAEAKAMTLEANPKADPAKVDAAIALHAPQVRPQTVPVSADAPKPTLRSAEAQSLIEKLRKKYQ